MCAEGALKTSAPGPVRFSFPALLISLPTFYFRQSGEERLTFCQPWIYGCPSYLTEFPRARKTLLLPRLEAGRLHFRDGLQVLLAVWFGRQPQGPLVTWVEVMMSALFQTWFLILFLCEEALLSHPCIKGHF